MFWDLRLGANRDLAPGVVTGADEIMQRLITRLQRELGEWFLDNTAGLPWYQKGEGFLGSKDRKNLMLFLRREVLRTEGVSRIIKINTIFEPSTRQHTIFLRIVVDQALIDLTLTERGAQWRTA